MLIVLHRSAACSFLTLPQTWRSLWARWQAEELRAHTRFSKSLRAIGRGSSSWCAMQILTRMQCQLLQYHANLVTMFWPATGGPTCQIRLISFSEKAEGHRMGSAADVS